MHWNCAILENEQKNIKNIFKIAHFLILCNSCAFLVLDYDTFILKSFNSGSNNVQTNSVLPAVWQLDAFKLHRS